jgi:hypothetical protein
MDRKYLLEQMLSARSPNETASAIYAAREWLAHHPEDGKVTSAMEDLIEVERESLGLLA